jgi:hypothetical protein
MEMSARCWQEEQEEAEVFTTHTHGNKQRMRSLSSPSSLHVLALRGKAEPVADIVQVAVVVLGFQSFIAGRIALRAMLRSSRPLGTSGSLGKLAGG